MRPEAGEPGLRLGYACLNTLFGSPARTTRLKNATPARLHELLAANLDTLEAILRWNDANDIRVFRVSSNTVPLASHPHASFSWREALGERFAELGDFMRRAGMRLSTHPGPYTVPASADAVIAAAAVRELDYHGELMSAFELDRSHKIVLHLGGGAGDRESWLDRFERAFGRLAPGTRERLVLEHDERWSFADVLPVAVELNVPVVFDAFHHEVNGSLPKHGVRQLVELAGETWREADGRQEVHFSTQAPGRRAGAHADTLDLRRFRRFAEQVDDLPLDCVLEVKDKEQSVVRARRTQVRLRQNAARPA
ncbi:MAG TPA: UV DNA damage repair endonuclease UvsE [Gaiellaceae bacterium]|jgi:UV DNA damage endonuclease|nr:UV DNA damage repair endonuclease UvsE [Gaiellaceae bacterium]